MAEPALSTSSPADGAADVFLNKAITATFSAALTSTTVTENSVILVNSATEEILDATVEYVAATFLVRVTPLTVLAENTVYKLKFPGTDAAISADYVIKDSASSDPLVTSIIVSFTTGTKTFIDDSAIAKDATDFSLEGDLNLPVHVKALGPLAVETSFPKNGKADVAVALNDTPTNQLWIKFSKPLSGALLADDWLEIDAYPMLDDTAYLGSGEAVGSGVIPAMTGLQASGNYLYAGFESEMPNNVAIDVYVGTGVTASDGSEFGYSDYKLSFTTLRYPKVSGPHAIKREIRSAAEELTDEYICATLLSNTMRLIQRHGTVNNSPTWTQMRWVLFRTIVDLLDDVELEKAVVQGTRRQLGDLNVSVDQAQQEGARLALKHARALKELESLDRAMAGKKKLAMAYTDTKGISDVVDRLWHGVAGKLVNSRFSNYQPNLPASNISVNRASKVPPEAPWW